MIPNQANSIELLKPSFFQPIFNLAQCTAVKNFALSCSPIDLTIPNLSHSCVIRALTYTFLLTIRRLSQRFQVLSRNLVFLFKKSFIKKCVPNKCMSKKVGFRKLSLCFHFHMNPSVLLRKKES